MAGRQGLEPRFYGPEPHVLPIGRSPSIFSNSDYFINKEILFCQESYFLIFDYEKCTFNGIQ
jgi:hypothetical protein